MKNKEFEDKFIKALKDDGFDVEMGETPTTYVDDADIMPHRKYTSFMNGFPKVEGKTCEFGFPLNALKYDAEHCIAFTIHNLQFLKGTKITVRPDSIGLDLWCRDYDIPMHNYDARPDNYLFVYCRLYSEKLDNLTLNDYLNSVNEWGRKYNEGATREMRDDMFDRMRADL